MFSKKKSRITTGERFLTYDNIKLKTFLEIAASGDYQSLVISGKVSCDECLEAWEKIVNKSNEGGQSFSTYFETSQRYAELLSDYNTIKATLFVLLFQVDTEYIEFLKSKGYVIDTTSKKKYEESIAAAMRRSDNLLTKIKMKQNEIALITDKSTSSRVIGFEEIMANISSLLGFTVTDDITLARYNEYRRIIAKKHEAQRQATVK